MYCVRTGCVRIDGGLKPSQRLVYLFSCKYDILEARSLRELARLESFEDAVEVAGVG